MFGQQILGGYTQGLWNHEKHRNANGTNSKDPHKGHRVSINPGWSEYIKIIDIIFLDKKIPILCDFKQTVD